MRMAGGGAPVFVYGALRSGTQRRTLCFGFVSEVAIACKRMARCDIGPYLSEKFVRRLGLAELRHWIIGRIDYKTPCHLK